MNVYIITYGKGSLMRILVTGGCGFIGSHLVDRLIKNGYEVFVIDNLSTGSRKNISSDAVFYYLDIRSANLIAVFEKIRPDIVFHLAAQVSVPLSVDDPNQDAEVNILGTIKVLEACNKVGIKRIVFSSSAAVYGLPVTLPINENHPLSPVSPYGISKMTAEFYIQLNQQISGMEYQILRYSNVYGPRQGSKNEGGVISVFNQRLRNKQSIKIFGSGNQTRDFVYVSDVVDANLAAIKSRANIIVNISTGIGTSLNQIVDCIKTIYTNDVDVFYTSGRSGDIDHSVLDNERAKRYLRWEAHYDINTGLKETLY